MIARACICASLFFFFRYFFSVICMTSARADMLVDGAPVSGSLFDFGMYFFHNAHDLLKRVRSANATFFFPCWIFLLLYCVDVIWF